MDAPKLISGGIHTDERGQLFFNNSVDLSPIKRLYFVEHPSTEIIRAWQAHKEEQKWFQIVKGSFELTLIKLNWLNLEASERFSLTLKDDKNEIVHVPGGFASGLRALENYSKIMICSDFTLQQSKNDDYRFEPEQWNI